MKKPKLKRRSVVILSMVVALVAGAIAVVPFFFSRSEVTSGRNKVRKLITTHDLGNLLPMMEQFDKGIRSGVFYPRWYADINKGYGAATPNFYPPGLLYLTTLVNAAWKDWVYTLFVICAVALAASGLALYFLARTFLSWRASAVAALVYMLLPYHMLDLYWRGAIPEFLGFVFMPLILYFAWRLGSEGRARYYATVGLLHGIYLMTHLPVGYLFTYVLALFALVWAAKERDLRIALRVGGGMAIAILLSAIYWLPAALEGKYTYEWASEAFPYHYTYITLLPTNEAFSQLINKAFTFLAVILLTTIVILRALPEVASVGRDLRGESPNDKARSYSQIRIWIIMALATIFMSTSFSIYISQLIPRIQVAVPPFRWLAITSVFTALLVGAATERLGNRPGLAPKTLWAYRVAIGAAVALNLLLSVQGVIIKALANPTYNPPANFIDGGFTPKGSTLPDRLPETPLVVIKPNGGASEIVRWEPQHREIAVRMDVTGTVRLKTYNFPGWTARIDGERVPLSSDNDGVQVVSVPPGRHTIETDFVDTLPRRLGAVFSGLGFVMILGLIMTGSIRRRSLKAKAPKREISMNVGGDQAHSAGASKEVPRRAKRVVLSLVVLAASLVALVLTWRLISVGRPSPTRNANSSAPSQGEAGGGTNVGVGSEVRLHVEGLTSVPVASDERALDELIAALALRSNEKVEELIQSGRVFQVDKSTRARIVELGSVKTKVRIIEGDHVMMDGWIPERWIR